MNYKDYKFWYIRRDDNDFIIEAAVRFYEGHYVDVQVHDTVKGMQMVNKYRRIKKLKTEIYTPEDFGQIKTDDELREFLNEQLDKVPGLEAVAKQRCQR